MPAPAALQFPLIDIHTHLMPERLFQAVRAYFRAHLWHPFYDAPIDELVETLLAAGVQPFRVHAVRPSRRHEPFVESLGSQRTDHVCAARASASARFIPMTTSCCPSWSRKRLCASACGAPSCILRSAASALDDPRLDPLYEARGRARGAVADPRGSAARDRTSTSAHAPSRA